MKNAIVREEELKNRIAVEFFDKFDCTRIIGSIDFAVKRKRPNCAIDCNDDYLLWAEAKAKVDGIPEMITQLVLTIGKARTFDKEPPPPFLGCFDSKKIAFLRYANLHEIFNLSDFNWKVSPSNRETKEFAQVESYIRKIVDSDISSEIFIFQFGRDDSELKRFIRDNFVLGKTETTRTRIDKNNFISIYNKWLEAVKPTILINDWGRAKQAGIIDGDFYLADLLSGENQTLKEKLFVVLRQTKYVMNRHENEIGLFTSTEVHFIDDQKAHTQFWARYQRPPLEEYWDYIVERRDLLVPQDVRERKGSFFTPKNWVDLSQKYIADVLGENWQDEYYVWDCAAGTGNLLAGLTNKYNVWASTLDKSDVDVMKDRIHNGANLLEDHVFQFDFLNDEFANLPRGLQGIIKDEKTRKKLVIYINPPYAEVSTLRGGKAGVNQSRIHSKYALKLGTAGREICAQFLARIYYEIPGCTVAEFSKLKLLQGSAFDKFRAFFMARLTTMFVVPANTFDNVKGDFPIGFKVWATEIDTKFEEIVADVFDSDGNFAGNKTYRSYDKKEYINKWISMFKSTSNESIGFMDGISGNDFQHNNVVFIVNSKGQLPNPRGIWVDQDNLIPASVYFAVRKAIPADWLNDRDQFLYPNDKWETDEVFRSDCLAFVLFSNNIQSKHGANHWIPFTESEVNSRDKFESRFMSDFIAGKPMHGQVETQQTSVFGRERERRRVSIEFSPDANSVLEFGKRLWKYYHALPNCNVNASLYDIREHFQGRNDKGRMNNKSDDDNYNELIAELRSALRALAKKIEPKVYEYGFLRR